MLDEGADTNAIEEWERKCAKLKKENDKLKQYLQETEKENNHLRRRTKS
jgi:prefoldin subunit 5